LYKTAFIHASSAQGFAPLGKTSGWNATKIKALDVNHAEMGTQTEKYIRDIFRGLRDVDPTFRTNPR